MQKEYSDELLDTHDELKKLFAVKISQNPKFKSKKINLYYIYLVLHSELREEFNLFIKEALIEMAKKNLSKEDLENFLEPIDELFAYHDQRLVKLESFDKKLTGEYNYDFIKWEKDLFVKPLINYKLPANEKNKIEFTTTIPGQFATFIKKVEQEKRPFTWHNYLYTGNIKNSRKYL